MIFAVPSLNRRLKQVNRVKVIVERILAKTNSQTEIKEVKVVTTEKTKIGRDLNAILLTTHETL